MDVQKPDGVHGTMEVFYILITVAVDLCNYNYNKFNVC